jgi:hypothetical protein
MRVKEAPATQGGKANSSGKRLEKTIEDDFGRNGVPTFRHSVNKGNRDLLAPRHLIKQVPYWKPWEMPPWTSGRRRRSYIDFVYYGPNASNGIGIEAKAQDEDGSVDLKLPTVVNELFPHMPWPEIWLIHDGDGIPPGLPQYLRHHVRRHRHKKIEIFSPSEARRAIKNLCGG